jgi:MFS family permease
MMLTLTNTGTMGTALSISASGMLLSSFIISTRGIKKNLIKILSVSLSLAGLFYSLMGLFPNVGIIIIFGFLFFSMLPFVDSSLEVLIRRNVDNEKQGRVWAIIYSVSQAGYLIAYATAGYLADMCSVLCFMNMGPLRGS